MFLRLNDMGIILCGLLLSDFCLDRKSLRTISFPFVEQRLKEYALNNSNSLLILVVTGSVLLFVMFVIAKWSTTA